MIGTNWFSNILIQKNNHVDMIMNVMNFVLTLPSS